MKKTFEDVRDDYEKNYSLKTVGAFHFKRSVLVRSYLLQDENRQQDFLSLLGNKVVRGKNEEGHN